VRCEQLTVPGTRCVATATYRAWVDGAPALHCTLHAKYHNVRQGPNERIDGEGNPTGAVEQDARRVSQALSALSTALSDLSALETLEIPADAERQLQALSWLIGDGELGDLETLADSRAPIVAELGAQLEVPPHPVADQQPAA
jgi:hypothetical protein